MSDIISITGYGIVCAIGNNAQEVLLSLRNGESGIGRMRYLETRHSDIPVGEVSLSNEEMKTMLGICEDSPVSRTSLMGAIAVRQALRQAGIKDLKYKRVALISGTTVGNMDITEKYYSRIKSDAPFPEVPCSNECGQSTTEIARYGGIPDAMVCTVSTACSSALNSIIIGAEMLRNDEADVVIAGGAEALTRFHLNGFNTLMILDKERCRPFDDTRAGLNLGEGAAFVVLEKNSTGGLAYIGGYGNRCDAFHQTASSDNGEGAFLAMRDAIGMAGLEAGDIQYVNAHGTGTPNNDLSESRALKRVFGDNMPEVSSTKSLTGHTTSASGSIETVISILAMRNGFTPANVGWSNPMPDGIIPTQGKSDIRIDNVLCNSFGFGGNDSSLVICRNAVAKSLLGNRKYKSRIAVDERITSVDELSGLREFCSPMESRRMGKLMRAALLAALKALKESGTDCPGAIVAATSRGMLEISQQFMDDMDNNNEETLKPTLFMQSTHNTIASAIAIRTGCHGYNVTYSQGDDSKEWAMRDAYRLVENGVADSVLVCSFDESTPVLDSICERRGVKPPMGIFAESFVIKRDDI